MRTDPTNYDPSRALAAAVVFQAIEDARHYPGSAREWFNGPDFAEWLELAEIEQTPDECREALRRQGVLT